MGMVSAPGPALGVIQWRLVACAVVRALPGWWGLGSSGGVFLSMPCVHVLVLQCPTAVAYALLYGYVCTFPPSRMSL